MIIYSKEKQLLIVPGRDDVVDIDTNEYYQSGYKEGYQEGYDQAYNENYQIGYDKGYADGSATCEDYLAMRITSPGNIVWKSNDSSTSAREIQYSINGEEWTSITSTTSGVQIPVSAGDVVRFKSNVTPGSNYIIYSTFSGTTAGFTLEGNIMSLGGGDKYQSLMEITQSYAFINLFRSCTGLTDASKLELPATTLANSCYQQMFWGCRNLTTTPELPAAKLVPSCYYYMFWGCSKTNYIKCLATDISAANCTSGWVDGVATSGTFVKAASMTEWKIGYSAVPYNWNIINA